MNNQKVTRKVKIDIEGMTCASCAGHVERALGKIGAKNIRVNPVAGKAFLDAINLSEVQLKDAVKDAGYTPTKVEFEESASSSSKQKKPTSGIDKWKRRLIGVWVLTLPLMFIMYSEKFLGFSLISMDLMTPVMLILSFPIIFIFGFHTIKMGLRGFYKFYFGMDSLIALGTLVAFSTGILSFYIPITDFSGVSGMIMTIFITGKYIEEKAKGRATTEIKKLLELGAKNARVLRDREEIEIPVSELKLKDILIVKPGEKIPTDGIVVKGESSVDESMVTGESIPTDKKVKSLVIGATIDRKSVV